MKHDDLLKQARAHWTECTSDAAERLNRLRGEEDAKFSAGEQWEEKDRKARELSGRPWLTFNRMQQFHHQVENEVRQNPISIKISPVDSGIDKDTAKVNQGLVRYIQYNSRAQSSTHAAFVEAARSGLGAFKLASDYCSDDSFDQDIRIEQIPDAIHRLWWDPFCKESDRSDARYFFEADDLSKEEYKKQFPKSRVASATFFDDAYGNLGHDWIGDHGVRVANYWWIETEIRTLLLLDTGDTAYRDQVPADLKTAVLKSREVQVKKIRCVKINGEEVLEEFEWPGASIPIFPVVGEEFFVEGCKARFSLTHFARDAQRLYNLMRTTEAELIGLAPKSPWVMAEGQDEGYEEIWAKANQIAFSRLPYKPTTVGGEMVPPPQRNVAEPPILAISRAAAEASDDMKAATGMYDASLGARSNETSGVAIEQRQREGDLANLHFIDNLGRSLCACGRSIVEVRHIFYDTPRTIRILGEDDTPEVVRINEQYTDENGKSRNYDMASAAKFDVTVSAAPNYTTQRQEAFAMLTEFGRAYPQLLQLAGDLIFRNSDIPGADMIADRLKKALPPELAADDKDEAAKVPPQVQAQLQQMAQMIEQLTGALSEATSAVESKTLELASRERIATTQVQGKLASDLLKMGSAEAIEELRQQLAVIQQRLEAERYEREMEERAKQEAEQPAMPEAA